MGPLIAISAVPPPIGESFIFLVTPIETISHHWKKCGIFFMLDVLVKWADCAYEKAS